MNTQPRRRPILAALGTTTLALALARCEDSNDNNGTGSSATITAPGIVGPNSSSPISDSQPTLTVTIGCAVSNGGRTQIAHLLRSADQALYAGKRAGRNCVFFAGRSGPVAAAETGPRAVTH